MATKWMVRKRSQRSIQTLVGMQCEVCGSAQSLQRHHPSYESAKVEILCRPCHVKADQRDGHRPTKKPKACKVCEREFLPHHSTKHATCSPACLSELCRRNAFKRWRKGAEQTIVTDSQDSAMPSSRRSSKSSAAPSGSA